MTASIVISIISLILCVIGFFFFYRYITQRTSSNQLLSGYRDEVYRLIAEIDTATDRDSLLVEERIKSLRKILEDTDKRISVYIREFERKHNNDGLYTNLGIGIRRSLDSQPSSEKPVSPAPPDETDRQSAPILSAPILSAPILAAPTESAEKKQNTRKSKAKRIKIDDSQPEKPKIKAQIAEMSAQGLPPAEIASRLGLSLAEVDLALNLLQC